MAGGARAQIQKTKDTWGLEAPKCLPWPLSLPLLLLLQLPPPLERERPASRGHSNGQGPSFGTEKQRELEPGGTMPVEVLGERLLGRLNDRELLSIAHVQEANSKFQAHGALVQGPQPQIAVHSLTQLLMERGSEAEVGKKEQELLSSSC